MLAHVAYSTSLYERPTLLQCNQRKAGQFQEDTEGDVRLHTSSFNNSASTSLFTLNSHPVGAPPN